MYLAKSDHLIRHGLLLMAATQVANLANLLFHMAMGRILVGESSVEYGILVAMLSAILILGTPLTAVATSAAFFAAMLQKENRIEAIRSLFAFWGKRLGLLALLLFICGVLALPFLKEFFHINSSIVILTAIVTMALSFFPPVLTGIFQGLQMFLLSAIVGNLWTVIRLFLGVALLLLFGKNAFYPLLAQMLGVILSIALGYIMLVKMLPHKEEALHSKPNINNTQNVPLYFFFSFTTLMAFSFLMNGDMLLVKHFFPPEKAGLYAQISTIARTIVFLPMPIAGALFPKVVSEKNLTPYDVRLLIKAIIFAILVIALSAGVTSLVPWLPLKIIYPATELTQELLHAIKCAVWAMAPLAATFILMNFELAQHRFAIVPILLGAGAIFGLTTSLLHNTIFNVIAFLAIANCLALLAIITIIILTHKKIV